MTEAQLRKACKVAPVYEVVCHAETCNGNADEGEIYTSRKEADQARENHIQLHLQGQFAGDELPRYREFE